MFGHLQRQIRHQQAAVLEDRAVLSAHVHAFRFQLLNKLATPRALMGGFGAGLLAALLRCRHAAPEEESAEGAPGHWQRLLGWLLRDVAMPVVLGAVTQAQASHAEDEL
jgi:hypothetical protein